MISIIRIYLENCMTHDVERSYICICKKCQVCPKEGVVCLKDIWFLSNIVGTFLKNSLASPKEKEEPKLSR